MEYPDEFRRPLQLSLASLIDHAKAYLDEGTPEAVDHFMRLMLAGRALVNGETRRVFVNPLQGVSYPAEGEYQITGDFDSLIGFCFTLPLKCAMAVYPVPSFQHTLTKTIHIRLQITINQVLHLIPAHKIPNICIGRFDMRHQIRLFFPKLYRENMPPKIDPEDIALIYDQAIHPAIRKLMPESLARWPASYAVAFAASKDSRGQIHYQSVDVPEALLGRFARHVRAALNRFPRFEDSVFQIEIRGTKGAYSFPFNDADAREYAFNLFIERLDNTRMGPHDNYYVDIGVEIHHDGHCVQWLDAAHQRLLAHALPSASSAAISALSRSSKMHKDISGHLFDLSGFRVETGTKGTADKVVYVNVYTTDKAVTYQLHDGIFRERRASELFPGPFPHLIDDINSISHTFAVCAGSQGTTQDGTARYELRVKMSNVDTALTTFPHELVQLSVVSIPNDIWWTFKYYRIAAIHYILNEFITDPPNSRATLPSLTLGAACIFMLNAVMSRPSDWRAETALQNTVCIHGPEDVGLDDEDLADMEYDQGEVVPLPREQGLFYLCDLVRDGRHQWLRVPQSRVLEIPQLCILYKAASISDIEARLGATGLTYTRRAANPARMSNRRSHTLNIKYTNPDAITPSVFGLDDMGIRLHDRLRLTGPDENHDDSDDSEDNIRDIQGLLPDAIVDRIWAQFPYDLIQVSPNLKDRYKPAYCTLSPADQSRVTLDLFNRPVFPFRNVWWRIRDEDFWNKTQFDRFFPPKGSKLSNLQNFMVCRYFQDWMKVMNQARPEAAKIIRRKVQEKFKRILWLPHTETSRIWDTRRIQPSQGIDKWTYLGSGGYEEPAAAPRIAVNPALGRNMQFQLGVAIAEEEEEDTPPPFENMNEPPAPQPILPQMPPPQIIPLFHLPPSREVSLHPDAPSYSPIGSPITLPGAKRGRSLTMESSILPKAKRPVPTAQREEEEESGDENGGLTQLFPSPKSAWIYETYGEFQPLEQDNEPIASLSQPVAGPSRLHSTGSKFWPMKEHIEEEEEEEEEETTQQYDTKGKGKERAKY